MNLTNALKEVVSDEFKSVIDNILTEENINSNAELILRLCKVITSEIDIVEKNHYFYWSQEMGKLYRKGNDLDEQREQKLMIFATQLIYTLRTFIHDEKITFHIATKTADGSYSNSAFIDQEQILKSLSAVTKKSIGVSNALQKYLIEEKSSKEFKTNRENLWHQVEELSKTSYTGTNVDVVDMKKGNAEDPHWAYQNQKQDIRIYLKFNKGRKSKQLIKYYDMKGDGSNSSLVDFNTGWLWQWYNKVLYGGTDEEYEKVSNALKAGSLLPIMQKKDWIAGTKEGDFQDLQRRQIQSKYANTKIISFNNIRHIIYDLERTLTEYIAEKSQMGNNVMSILQEHFFPESARIGNAYAQDVLQKEILNKFNSAIK